MLSERDYYDLSVSEYCLKRGGACNGCPHNRLESQKCKVKYSEGVAHKLGLKAIKAKGNGCKTCGVEVGLRRTYCVPCAVETKKEVYKRYHERQRMA